jgi:NAD(P)H dehydrogenase (quinone)
VDRFGEADFEPVAERLRERMRTLETIRPIPYRQQNGGDYHIPSMQLRPELGDPGAMGFALHEDRAGATAKPVTSRSTLRDVA